MIWSIRCNNSIVTDRYMEVIENSFKLTSQSVTIVNHVKNALHGKNQDYYLVGGVIDAIKLYITGKKNIIVWIQGVLPEESYSRRHNMVRKSILEKCEKYVLNRATFVFFVSREMKKHYESKYSLSFEQRNYIMPCFNTEIVKESFFCENKYEKSIYTYVGSLEGWQCFDKIAQLYKKLEDSQNKPMEFWIFTSQKAKAKEIVTSLNIKNYRIDFVESNGLNQALGPVKFAFVLRENNIINRVATPTKISTYLANGIIPIYSEALKDFAHVAADMTYVLCADNPHFNEKIRFFSEEPIDTKAIFKEYSHIFNTYYSRDYHQKKIIEIICNLIINA